MGRGRETLRRSHEGVGGAEGGAGFGKEEDVFLPGKQDNQLGWGGGGWGGCS